MAVVFYHVGYWMAETKPHNPHSVGHARDLESSLDLLRRAQDGDGRALDQLCERYLPRLRRWASGRLPGRARDLLDTEDVIQEAFIRTVQRLRHLAPARSAALQAYFRQTVLNLIRDEIRRPHGGVPLDERNDLIARQPSPLEVAIGRNTVDRYEAALAKLSAVDQEAIVARVEFECNYSELAELLGKHSPDAARVAVGRALVRLAREMAHERE